LPNENAVFLRLGFLALFLSGLHQVLDVIRDSMQFGLKTGNEIAWSVLEKDDEAKGEKDEEEKPKKTADKTHARRLAD
jgi:hypothetical protein